MLHIIEHTLLDSIKLVPFLFLTYLAMEYLEHRAGEKTIGMVRKAGKWGPFIGGVAGVAPQCGFSAAASNLYAGRIISLGTLLAIYLSTSDEMLPIFISERVPVDIMVKILALKAAIGVAAGFIVDFAMRRMLGADNFGNAHTVKGHTHSGEQHKHTENYDAHHEHDHHHHDHEEEHFHIHEMCEHDHCDCEKDGIFLSAVKHTLQITFFIILITFALNLVLHFVGEDVLANLILDRPVLGPVLAGIVGLVPNCAASVVVTQLYLEGVIGMGAMMSGLLVGAGVGLLVLFRVNHDKKENLKIVGLLYSIGVLAGIVIELFV